MSVLASLVAAPLARHEVVDTSDVDLARIVGGQLFRDHQLIPGHDHAQFRARLRSATVGGTKLTYVDYTAAVRIATAVPSDGFLVHIPLSGRASVTCGRATVHSDPATAAVIDPADRLEMTWAGGTPLLIVGLDRSRVEQHLRTTLGGSLRRPLRFDLAMDLTTPAAQAWLSVLELLVREVSHSADPPFALEQLEALAFQRFLLAQPNTYSESLADDRPAAPQAIRKAMSLIEDHAAEPLVVEDVAEAVGLGVRALQAGFRRHSDSTPMGYLREIRLRRVHAELLAADPAHTSVTAIAARWQFLHLGRFAVQYRERFGERPSVTLHR